MSLIKLKQSLKKASNKEHAKILQRFFKTGPGEYGEGDVFIGIKVPPLRQIAKENLDLSFDKVQELFQSEIHEERLVALMILVLRYKKEDEKTREKIFKIYLKNTNRINNWDLVDLSAGEIVGAYLFDKEKDILFKLVKSKLLWERRISVIASFYFIKNNSFETTLKLSEQLLNDKHDLIHKAVGWMLREIGKRNMEVEEEFLRKYYKTMPRTMLRYAIEKFPEEKRLAYLKGTIL
jgi:3-methyladenine DNA glycosylase AlkD